MQTAMETARIAFAPSLPLFSVPSSAFIFASTAFWSVGSLPTNAGPISLLTLSTAFITPLPMYSLPPSRSSTAS